MALHPRPIYHVCELSDTHSLVSHKAPRDTVHDRLNVIRNLLDDLTDDGTWELNPREYGLLNRAMTTIDAAHHDYTERTQAK